MNALFQIPASDALLEGLIERLGEMVGATHVLKGTEVEVFATDIYRSLAMPLAVVQPGTVEELRSVVHAATQAGMAVFTRGGGASYTDGYLPTRRESILIDMTRLNRIVELNQHDAYVTVEAGITWAALKAALDPLGLRTPFFGPFSGLMATVGGSLSQHTISHGSGAHGISAQSLLSLDVVMAAGALIRTGSAARSSASDTSLEAAPFTRWFGPDLAGLFTGDCGALGIKARITLPLLKQQPAFECASFGFPNFSTLANAMRAAALEHLDDEHFAIDAALMQGQIARQKRVSPLAAIAAVWQSASSPIAALKQLVQIAMAGTNKLLEPAYLVHYTVEGVTQAEARLRMNRIRHLMLQEGAEFPNTIPAVVRGMPFPPFFNALGPKGELWIPVHGIIPHSRAEKLHVSVQQHFTNRAAEMQRLGVWTAGMFLALGGSGLLYELALYWPGKRSVHHQAVVPAEYLAQLPLDEEQFPGQHAQAAAFIEQLKQDLIALFGEFGATHFQIGKFYPFANVIAPENLALLRAIKQSLDPDGLINPGALGL